MIKHIDNVTSFLSDGEFVKKSKIFIDIEYQDVVWTKLVDTSFSIIDKKKNHLSNEHAQGEYFRITNL